jgi:alpha-galactosidase/6-phospho-beta-glucosidase family protein
VYAAIAMDRLTGAVLSLEGIRAMTDELLEAEREWLPELR